MKKVLLILLFVMGVQANQLPKDFVYVQKKIPSIELDLRYHTHNNFVGEKVDGYKAAQAVLTVEATTALKKMQNYLQNFGLGLKVFDAYRPQKAVDHFVRWGKDLDDEKMKMEYYPNVEKKNLFKEGYIAKHSGHSRGSTIDLTLIDLTTKEELDMGSSFDKFDPCSWGHYQNITTQQRANRAFLQSVMVLFGFKPYKQEWWHFTLKNEPYPKRYFDFDVE